MHFFDLFVHRSQTFFVFLVDASSFIHEGQDLFVVSVVRIFLVYCTVVKRCFIAFFFACSSSAATVVFPLQTMNFLHALCHASLVLSCPSRLFSCLIRSFEDVSAFCFVLETRNVP